MKKLILLIIAVAVIIVIAVLLAGTQTAGRDDSSITPAKLNSYPANMTISSSAFEQNSALPEKFSCDGEGSSPPLSFGGVPETASSLVLILDDPDAPSGDFVHWLVWNLPVASGINEGSVPDGAVEGTNSGGEAGYFPPCPPSGNHNYTFRIYALDTKLDLSPATKKPELLSAMNGHILDQGELIAPYSR
jgi:Raf kinase inhibitor-like YbhB/YbcL family protein